MFISDHTGFRIHCKHLGQIILPSLSLHVKKKKTHHVWGRHHNQIIQIKSFLFCVFNSYFTKKKLSEVELNISEIRWEVIQSHECHFKELEFFRQRANKGVLTRWDAIRYVLIYPPCFLSDFLLHPELASATTGDQYRCRKKLHIYIKYD